MTTLWHFPVFMGTTWWAFVGVLRFCLRGRPSPVCRQQLAELAGVVVCGGMLFAKYGANAGFHWLLYYGVPALLAWVLPPVALGMSRKESSIYLLAGALLSPVLHLLFSFVLGWHEYLPFIAVPWWGDVLGPVIEVVFQ